MIVNLTQHNPTSEQRSEGVMNPRPEVSELLTFNTLPTMDEIYKRVAALVNVAMNCQECGGNGNGCDSLQCATGGVTPRGTMVMIGGAPYLMGTLERALKTHGLQPVYAFSERVSTEQVQPDGSIKKVAEFRHRGFVKV